MRCEVDRARSEAAAARGELAKCQEVLEELRSGGKVGGAALDAAATSMAASSAGPCKACADLEVRLRDAELTRDIEASDKQQLLAQMELLLDEASTGDGDEALGQGRTVTELVEKSLVAERECHRLRVQVEAAATARQSLEAELAAAKTEAAAAAAAKSAVTDSSGQQACTCDPRDKERLAMEAAKLKVYVAEYKKKADTKIATVADNLSKAEAEVDALDALLERTVEVVASRAGESADVAACLDEIHTIIEERDA
jgi:hypothetical protein